MDIKPTTSQTPIVTQQQTQTDAIQTNKSGEQEAKGIGNTQTDANSAEAMKQAGAEKKGTMKTSQQVLQQTLNDQLQQKEGNSTQLRGWPETKGTQQASLFNSQVSSQTQGATQTTSNTGPIAPAQANPKMAEASKEFEKGQAAYAAGKYQEALEAFTKADQLYPHPDFKYNQGACFQRMGKSELAAIKYEEYLAGKPDASDAAQVRGAITKLHEKALNSAQSAYDRGRAAYDSGNFKEAASAFAEAYEQKPMPQFLYNRAAAFDMAGDKKEAVKNYQLYLTMHPNADDADRVRNRMNKLLKSTGDELMNPDPYKAAQEAADRGKKAYDSGNFKEAAAAFTQAYENEPNPDLLYNIGASYQRAGNIKEAVKNYQLYLNKHPDAKDAEKVRNHIHKLLEKTGDGLIDPSLEGAQAAFDRGEAAYNAGNFTEAAKAFAEAYKEKPFPQFLYNVGAAFHRAGDTKEAVKYYQQYLNAYPDAKDADKVRSAIHKLLEKTGDGLIQP